MYFVRGSELNDFLRCRLRWKFQWIDGLKAKKPNNKLFFGTLMHKFLEVFYDHNNQGDQWTEAFAQMQYLLQDTDTSGMDEIEYQEIKELIDVIPYNYSNHYDDRNWEVIATELTFAIPLDDEIGYTGTIDLIVRDKKDGRIYFLDHKTTSSIDKYDKASDMDRQISRYWWALQQLALGNGFIKIGDDFVPADSWKAEQLLHEKADITPYGFLYNIIMKDYPVPPKVLKDGSLSKAKNQNTTARMYMDALMEMGIAKPTGEDAWHEVPTEYSEVLIHFRDNPREYFRRTRVFRTQAEIDASIEELYVTALDMADQKLAVHYQDIHTKLDKPRIYRNITKDCPWDCAFMEVCRAGMDGSNVDFLVDTLYTKEDTHE